MTAVVRGLTPFRKAAVPATTVPSTAVGQASSWWGSIRESFAGAWQNNVVADPQHTLLAFSAVYASVTMIAGDISKLRMKLVEFKDGVWQETENAAYSPVLRKPNHYQTRIQFLNQWLQSKLVFGNSYILKERDKRGVVVALYVLDPRLVKALITEDGEVYYQVGTDRLSGIKTAFTVPASEIIHDRTSCFFHPLIGISPIYACGISATQGNRIQQNSAKFFENMSRPSGQLTSPETIDDVTAERLKREFEERFSGQNLGRLLVTGDGLKYEPISIPAKDAQMIEQLKWTVEDVARCFVPGTPVLTGRGMIPIEEIVIGDTVLTHKGRWRKVEQTIKSDFVGKVFKIRAKGLAPITATANHPFYVQSLKPNRSHRLMEIGEPKWILAEEMTPTMRRESGERSRKSFDCLTMPRLQGTGARTIDMADHVDTCFQINDTTIRASDNHRATACNRHIDVDQAFGWLCGLFVADGTSAGHQVVFSLTEHEVDIADLLCHRIRDKFGVEPTRAVRRGMIHVTVSNRVVNSFFKQFGTGAHAKALPQWCLEASEDFRVGLINGMVDGDGCVYQGYTKIKTVSVSLSAQIRMLLWAQDQHASVTAVAPVQKVINGKICSQREAFEISWRTDPSKRGVMGSTDEVCYFSLDEMEPSTYAGPVYNLEVEEDHSYTTAGGVAHNCFHVPLHKIGAATNVKFSNMAEMNQDYYSQTLQELIECVELLLDEGLGLTGGPQTLGVELDLEALLRMDPVQRAERTDKLIKAAVMAPNEGRRIENLPPVAGGNEPYLQQQNYPLSQLSKQPAPGAAPPPPAPVEPEEDDEDETKLESEAAKAAMQSITKMVDDFSSRMTEAAAQEAERATRRDAVATEQIEAIRRTALELQAERDSISAEKAELAEAAAAREFMETILKGFEHV